MSSKDKEKMKNSKVSKFRNTNFLKKLSQHFIDNNKNDESPKIYSTEENLIPSSKLDTHSLDNSSKVNFIATSKRSVNEKVKKMKSEYKYLNLKENDESEDYFTFLEEVYKKEEYYQGIEMITEQLCRKRKIQEFVCALFAFISVISGFIYQQLKTLGDSTDEYKDQKINLALIVISISNLFFIISTIGRYQIEHWIDQANGNALKNETLYDTGSWKRMSLEIIYCLIHPNIFFHDKYFFSVTSIYFTTTGSQNLQTFISFIVKYQLNDYLCIISYVRLFVILRFYLTLTPYYEERSNRIGKFLEIKTDRMFAIRCLLASEPYFFILIVTIVIVLMYTLMMCTIETPVYTALGSPQMKSGVINFSIIQNSLWAVVVSMATVGYGDYTAKTFLGRFVSVFSAFTGTFIISFMVVALQNYVKLTFNEEKAFEMKSKMEMNKEISNTSGKFFLLTHKYIKAKKNYQNALKSGRKNLINKTFKESLKCLYAKITAQKEFKQTMHKFRSLYEPYSDIESIKQRINIITTNVEDDLEISDKNNQLIKDISMMTKEIETVVQNYLSKKEIDHFITHEGI